MYIATINVPGYLPTGCPVEFDTTQEAWQYLAREVDHAWDYCPDDDNGACIEADTALGLVDRTQPGTVYAPTPGYRGDHDLGLAYTVQEA